MKDVLNNKNPEDGCVIHNGIDFSRFDNCGGQDYIPEENRHFNLLIFGNAPATKGIDIAIESLNYAGNNDLTLYITVSPKKAENLENFLNSCNIPDKLKNHIQVIPACENVGAYYKACSIFLSPSRHEAFPYSIGEATYCGCKVIASRIPGQDENAAPDIRWIGDPNSETDIARQLAEAIDDMLSVKTDNSENIKKVQETMSLKAWVSQTCQIIDDLNKE